MSVVMSLKFPIEVNWIYKLELYLYFQNSACTGLQFDIPVAAFVSFFQSVVWVYGSSCSACWSMLNKYQIQHTRLPSSTVYWVYSEIGEIKGTIFDLGWFLTLLLVDHDFQCVENFYFNYYWNISRNILLKCLL